MTSEEVLSVWRAWAGEDATKRLQLDTLEDYYRDGLTTLDLSSTSLIDLPDAWPENLITLNLADNFLTEYPKNLPAGTQNIDLSGNHLDRGPTSSEIPSGLRSLDVSMNYFPDIPEELFTLPPEVSVDYTENHLSAESSTRLWTSVNANPLAPTIVYDGYREGTSDSDSGPVSLPATLDPALTGSWTSWVDSAPPGEKAARQTAVKRMREAVVTNDVTLDLSDLKLTTLPTRLPPNILELDIAANELSVLPDSLPDSLNSLDASNNKISSFAGELPKSLRTLNLADNKPLTTLPDALPPHLLELYLAYCDLHSLPVLPETIETLTLSDNQNLSALPDKLPPALKTLEISYTKITDLGVLPSGLEMLSASFMTDLHSIPENLPDSLKYLYMRESGITIMPDALPKNLEILDLQGNKILHLTTEWPEGLRILDIRNNKIVELTQLPDSLISLNASYNDIHTIEGELPGKIQSVYLDHNDLVEAPDIKSKEISHLYLYNNPLESLPESYFKLPTFSTVILGNTNLPPNYVTDMLSRVVENNPGQVRDEIGPTWNNVPETGRDVFNNPAVPPSLVDAVTLWFEGREAQFPDILNKWQAIAASERNQSRRFAGFVDRFFFTQNSVETTPEFRTYIANWLAELAENPALRTETYNIATQSLAACDDRLSYYYNKMQLARSEDTFVKLVNSGDLKAAITTAREIYRVRLLEGIADNKVSSILKDDPSFKEGLETHLTFLANLKDALHLTTVSGGVLFSAYSKVTQEDITHAEHTIKGLEGAKFLEWLSSWDPWKVALNKYKSARFAEAEGVFVVKVMGLDDKAIEILTPSGEQHSRTAVIQVTNELTKDLRLEIYGSLTKSMLDDMNMASLLDSPWAASDAQAVSDGVPTSYVEKLITHHALIESAAGALSTIIGHFHEEGASLRFAPQTFLLGDSATGICEALSEAWLFTSAQNDGGILSKTLLDEVFLRSPLTTDGKAAAEPLVDILKSLRNNNSRSIRTLSEVMHDLVSATGDISLSLHTGNHALALARKTVNGEVQYRLYDPNLGEITLPAGGNAATTESSLVSLFNQLMEMNVGTGRETLADFYQTVTRNGEYTFTVSAPSTTSANMAELSHFLNNDMAAQSVVTERLKTIKGSEEGHSAALSIVDSVATAKATLKDDFTTLGTRLKESVVNAGFRLEDIVQDSIRYEEARRIIQYTVKDSSGNAQHLEADVSDLKFKSTEFVNSTTEKLSELTSRTYANATEASSAINEGIAALMTLRSFQSMMEGIQNNNSEAIAAGAGWTIFGIASQAKIDGLLFDKLGALGGKLFFRDAKLAVTDMSSFVSKITTSLLQKVGVVDAKILSVASNSLARLPIVAIAFGAWTITEDAKAIVEHQEENAPQWRQDLDIAETVMDGLSTVLQTIAPFTGPAAPFVEAAAMLVMLVRMSVDDIVTDFNTGHSSRATKTLALSVLFPAYIIAKPFIKMLGGNDTIRSVSDVDNLFQLTAPSVEGEASGLDLTRGSKLSDIELNDDGNPANYAGALTIDFSQVTEKGGVLKINAQHAPAEGVLYGKEGLTVSGTHQVNTGIGQVILGSGASYDQKGVLSQGVAFTAMEHIIANGEDNAFLAPRQSSNSVTDSQGDKALYLYDIDAGKGDDTLYVSGGQYEFDGGEGQDTLVADQVTAGEKETLVWDLSTQSPLPAMRKAGASYRLLTSLTEEQANAAAEGQLVDVSERQLLTDTQITANSVDAISGTWRADVTVNTGGTFSTAGAKREVFVSSANADSIYTKGGNDVIYRSTGNDNFIINRSYSLTATHGQDHLNFSSDESERIALLEAGADKTWLYTEVTLIKPVTLKPGNDFVRLEGALYNNIHIQDEGKNGILVGYGDKESAGLNVRVLDRSGLTGLHFLTDDGVIFSVNVPDTANKQPSANIEMVQGVSYVQKSPVGATLPLAADEDGFDVQVSRGDYLNISSPSWTAGRIILDADFKELRFRHDGLGHFVIDTGEDPRLNNLNLQVGIFEDNINHIELVTRDGYSLELSQTSPGIWATQSAVLHAAAGNSDKIITSPLLSALVTHGTGALSLGTLDTPGWRASEISGSAGAQGVVLVAEHQDGWFLGGEGNDTLMAFSGTTVLDGGNGIDTYVLKRGQGTVIIADSGTHSGSDNWSDKPADKLASMVVLQDITLQEISVLVATMDVNGVKQQVLELQGGKGNDAVTAKLLLSDLKGYQFVTADGVSFTYSVEADGRVLEHIIGLDRDTWSAWYKPGNGHTEPDVDAVLYRLEGRYDGSSTTDNVTLHQPGVLVTTGRGEDNLHLQANAGGAIQLRAGDGHKTITLDAVQGHSLQLPVTVLPGYGQSTLQGVTKDVWNNVSEADVAQMQTLMSSRPADKTESNVVLSGLTEAGQLVRLSGQLFMHANHSYRFRDFSAFTKSFNVVGPDPTGYTLTHAEDGTVTVTVSGSGQGYYTFSELIWSGEDGGSYALRYGISDVTAVTGNWRDPAVDMGITSAGALSGERLTLNFVDFNQHDIHTDLSQDRQTLTLSAGEGDNAVSVTVRYAELEKYQIATGDGVISWMNDGGQLSLHSADFSVQSASGTLDLTPYAHQITSPESLVTVNGDDRGNTFIAAENQSVMVSLGGGDDVAVGSRHSDILTGSDGHDMLLAQAGDDVLNGGLGADVLDGGDGSDTVFYEGNSLTRKGVTIDLLSGRGQGEDAEGDLLRNVENIRGSDYADILMGDQGNNILEGNTGNDTLTGNGGMDILRGGAGEDTYVIRSGDDVLLSKTLSLKGDEDDASRDTIILDVSGSVISSRVDNSLVVMIGDTRFTLVDWYGRASAQNYLFVVPGASGESVKTELEGADFVTWLNAMQANSTKVARYTGGMWTPAAVNSAAQDIIDSTGQDNLVGNAQSNRIWGLAGDDVLEGGGSSDLLVGGKGQDTASYAGSSQSVEVNLSVIDAQGNSVARGGDAQGDVLSGIENLRGSAFDDALTGNDENNVIEGGGGADVLNGGSGFDLVSYEHSVGYWAPETYDDNVHVREDQKGKNIGVYADLASGEARRGDAGIVSHDVLRNIEGVTGSAWSDDLYGDNQDNLFILNGYEDNGYNNQRDYVDGRDGSDTVSFAGGFYDRGVNVYVGREGYAVYSDSQLAATLKNIENAVGSGGDDRLVGDDQNNVLSGGAGKDILEGHGGTDLLIGGAGYDDYRISAGDHVVISQANNGDATDVVHFNDVTDFKKELQFTAEGDDIVIRSLDGNTSVVLKNWEKGDSHYTLTDGYTTLKTMDEVRALLPSTRVWGAPQEVGIQNSSFEQEGLWRNQNHNHGLGWDMSGDPYPHTGLVRSTLSVPDGEVAMGLWGHTTMGQNLSETLDANAQYQLSVSSSADRQGEAHLQLWAGDTMLGDTLLAFRNYVWTTDVLNVDGAQYAGLAGKALQIRVVSGENGVSVDNFHLQKLVSTMATLAPSAPSSTSDIGAMMGAARPWLLPQIAAAGS